MYSGLRTSLDGSENNRTGLPKVLKIESLLANNAAKRVHISQTNKY